MRRILMLVTVATIAAVMMVAMALPAFAGPTWKDRDGDGETCTWGWGGNSDSCYDFGTKPGKVK
jgi:hypothetical protein